MVRSAGNGESPKSRYWSSHIGSDRTQSQAAENQNRTGINTPAAGAEIKNERLRAKAWTTEEWKEQARQAGSGWQSGNSYEERSLLFFGDGGRPVSREWLWALGLRLMRKVGPVKRPKPSNMGLSHSGAAIRSETRLGTKSCYENSQRPKFSHVPRWDVGDKPIRRVHAVQAKPYEYKGHKYGRTRIRGRECCLRVTWRLEFKIWDIHKINAMKYLGRQACNSVAD